MNQLAARQRQTQPPALLPHDEGHLGRGSSGRRQVPHRGRWPRQARRHPVHPQDRLRLGLVLLRVRAGLIRPGAGRGHPQGCGDVRGPGHRGRRPRPDNHQQIHRQGCQGEHEQEGRQGHRHQPLDAPRHDPHREAVRVQLRLLRPRAALLVRRPSGLLPHERRRVTRRQLPPVRRQGVPQPGGARARRGHHVLRVDLRAAGQDGRVPGEDQARHAAHAEAGLGVLGARGVGQLRGRAPQVPGAVHELLLHRVELHTVHRGGVDGAGASRRGQEGTVMDDEWRAVLYYEGYITVLSWDVRDVSCVKGILDVLPASSSVSPSQPSSHLRSPSSTSIVGYYPYPPLIGGMMATSHPSPSAVFSVAYSWFTASTHDSSTDSSDGCFATSAALRVSVSAAPPTSNDSSVIPPVASLARAKYST